MITFLPWADYVDSAKALDYRRLGKQRVEAYQLLRGLLGISTGWIHHPASKMWKGYEPALASYTVDICDEWIYRGYRDTILDKVLELIDAHKLALVKHPSWLGNEDFHRSHRANLVRKNPKYYVPLFGDLPPEPYIWP